MNTNTSSLTICGGFRLGVNYVLYTVCHQRLEMSPIVIMFWIEFVYLQVQMLDVTPL